MRTNDQTYDALAYQVMLRVCPHLPSTERERAVGRKCVYFLDGRS